MTKHLPLHEWTIILLFCFILLLIAGFAFGRSKPTPFQNHFPQQSEEMSILNVTIHGEIAKPGLYRLPSRSSIKQLLEQAEPLASADLSQMQWRKHLREGQTIHVPKRGPITIYLEGAVEQSGALQVLSGSRVNEVINAFKPLPEADLLGLKRRKGFVKEGMIIKVPFKKKREKKPAKTEGTTKTLKTRT